MTLAFAILLAAPPPDAALKARDAQDRAALDRLAAEAESQAQGAPQNHAAQYRAAAVQLYRAQAALEANDRQMARDAAESGIRLAEKAVEMQPANAEYRRMLGSLCGQVIPAAKLLALKYGRCALEQVKKATELDPKSSDAWLSHGVGNYYLPEAFGGGFQLALADIQKAIQLNPKNAEAQLWLGLTLRKLNRNAEARKAIQESLRLNPGRVWAKQQLDKTPAQ